MLLTKQPQAFVIALKDHEISQAQLKDCIASAEQFGWTVEPFWGVNGREVTAQSWQDIGVVPMLEKPTMHRPGTHGCFFSHWKLWNLCVEMNEPIVVLEHDAMFQGEWIPIELDQSLIKLHRYYSKKIKIDPDSGRWSNSTHAYCIAPVHAKKLIDFAQSVGGFATDMIMGDRVLSVEHPFGKTELVARQNSYSTTLHL